MPSKAQYFFLLTLLGLSPPALATTVLRCEAANGHITFTTLGCATGESVSLERVQTFTPGNTTALLPPAESRNALKTNARMNTLTIVEQAEDPCGNLISAKVRRVAIKNQRIVAGMSQQDVESALGKPDKVSIRNSSTRYHYDTQRGRSAQIEFDERGCTKGKAKSQTAKSPQ
ncbi:cell envelope protein SmpA [Pseudomonas vancouverensis]|uniref:cell envelope protein SmpA n=1 Tax=Pseudomonas vancouverensis TaxID=95300 RepID=UPI003D017EF4